MSQLINEIKQDLKKVDKPLKEEKKVRKSTLMEMVFSDQMDPNEIDNPGYDTSAGGEEYAANGEDNMAPIQGTLPSEAAMDPEIKEMLADIRVAVIKALGKLANRSESSEYDLMKKMLTLIDKPVETQNKTK
jgi:hypothetical protein